MPRLVLAFLSSVSLVFAGLSLAPTVAVANDPCPVGITIGGADPTTVQVERTSYSIYCVAKFKAVSTDYVFTVPEGITKLDYLVVGGGGGGASGGGGGGGLLRATDFTVSPNQAISITVGAGGQRGAGGIRTASAATSGSQSKFGSITAAGGGEGGAQGVSEGMNGASGGGARYDCTSSGCGNGIAGTSIAGQGNNGGYSTYPSYGAGGGGGGAGGSGFNTTRNYIGGNGGIGIVSNITGVDVYYAGGGGGGINSNDNQYVGVNSSGNLEYSSSTPLTNGGGAGGLGGGGRGSSWGFTGGTSGEKANATAGEANTGGGGGGTDPEDSHAGAGGSGVVILRWISNANLKTITFNSNSPAAQTSTQLVGAGVATALRTATFSRTGYVFVGWTANSNGSGTVYQDASSFTTSADITLFAKWEAGVTHTITFNANGGTGSMPSQTAGASVAVNSNVYTRSDFIFNGWNTESNGSGFAYNDGAIYAFQSSTTLYAQWQAVVPSYRVSFFGNGATSGTTASQSASASTALNLNGFARTGYSFLGWSENYAASSATLLDGQSFAFDSNKNLYAIWVVQASRNLTFDGNGAASGSTASQAASTNTLLNENGFILSGSTFLNWNTAANGSGVSYQSNYVYSFAAALTLYAQWGQNLTVTYSGNSPATGTAPSVQSTYAGSPGVNLPLNTGNLKKTGYRLAGWNTNSSGTGTPYALGASSVRFNSSVTLHAQWAPAVYSVIYAANGATAGSEPSVGTFVYGDSITVARNTGQLEKPGFTFAGWSTSPDGTGETFEPATSNVALSSDTVLFAKWLSSASGSAPRDFESTLIQNPKLGIPNSAKNPVFKDFTGLVGLLPTQTKSIRSKIRALLDSNPGYSAVKIEGSAITPKTLRLIDFSATTNRNIDSSATTNRKLAKSFILEHVTSTKKWITVVLRFPKKTNP